MKLLTSKSNFWLGPVLGGICVLSSMASWASCTPKGDSISINFSVPSTLTIPRDTPIGAEVYRSDIVSLSKVPSFRCSPDERAGYTSVGTTASSGPSPLGSSGLGWRMVEDDVVIPPYPNGQLYKADTDYSFGTGGIILYKMGEVSTVSAGRIGAYVAGGRELFYFRLANSIQPLVASCETPSVNVPLGTHVSSKFKDVGSTVGETAFSIKLNNCPAGLTSIDYQLDPINRTWDVANGVFEIDEGGAEGVGIQIVNDLGDPVVLRAPHNFLKNVSAGNYIIPLKAAYYKIARTVVGGAANASVQFTITYQ